MLSGTKMMSHIGRIMDDHRPITADIFLTNYCNNKCPYCTYNRWERDPGARAMSFEDFRKYATRLTELGVTGMILSGGGEPTLAPDFDRIADWLTAEGIHWGINTNFNLCKYIEPDYLKVSLDGWNGKSYIQARGVDAYEKVRDNIQRYAKWKRRTRLGIQMVATDAVDVYRFYYANRDLDVDYISFRPVESTGGHFYRSIHTPVQDILTAIDELMDMDDRVVRNFKWDMLYRQESTCTAQWAQIAVNEAGQVIYCCHKPYQIIGHIMEPDILKRKEQALTNMRMCDIPCRMTAPNMFVAQLNEKREDECFI